MSGIYIPGMEMPKRNFLDLRIEPDGYIYQLIGHNTYLKPYKAIAVPDHGRLIDADALLLKLLTAESGKVYDFCYPCKEVLQAIKDSPTIIERETN